MCVFPGVAAGSVSADAAMVMRMYGALAAMACLVALGLLLNARLIARMEQQDWPAPTQAGHEPPNAARRHSLRTSNAFGLQVHTGDDDGRPGWLLTRDVLQEASASLPLWSTHCRPPAALERQWNVDTWLSSNYFGHFSPAFSRAEVTKMADVLRLKRIDLAFLGVGRAEVDALLFLIGSLRAACLALDAQARVTRKPPTARPAREEELTGDLRVSWSGPGQPLRTVASVPRLWRPDVLYVCNETRAKEHRAASPAMYNGIDTGAENVPLQVLLLTRRFLNAVQLPFYLDGETALANARACHLGPRHVLQLSVPGFFMTPRKRKEFDEALPRFGIKMHYEFGKLGRVGNEMKLRYKDYPTGKANIVFTDVSRDCTPQPGNSTNRSLCTFYWHLWPGGDQSGAYVTCPTSLMSFALTTLHGHLFWVAHPLERWLLHEFGSWRGASHPVYKPCLFKEPHWPNGTRHRLQYLPVVQRPDWVPSTDAVQQLMNEATKV